MRFPFQGRRPRPPKATVLTIGMRVEFNGKLWTISSDSSYYDDGINLLLEPVKRADASFDV